MTAPGDAAAPPAGLDRVFRAEYGRCVATLVRILGDLDLAEEAVQEAFTVAAATWPVHGTPPNPGGWISTTARRRAIDRLRRESTRADRHRQAALLHAPDEPQEAGPVTETGCACCSPAAIRRWRSPRRWR